MKDKGLLAQERDDLIIDTILDLLSSHRLDYSEALELIRVIEYRLKNPEF